MHRQRVSYHHARRSLKISWTHVTSVSVFGVITSIASIASEIAKREFYCASVRQLQSCTSLKITHTRAMSVSVFGVITSIENSETHALKSVLKASHESWILVCAIIYQTLIPLHGTFFREPEAIRFYSIRQFKKFNSSTERSNDYSTDTT